MRKTEDGRVEVASGCARADADVICQDLAHEFVGKDGSCDSEMRTSDGDEESGTAAGGSNGLILFGHQCTHGQTHNIVHEERHTSLEQYIAIMQHSA